MDNNLANELYALLERIVLLQERGFRQCTRVDTEGNQWDVYSIGSPDQGYEAEEIFALDDKAFQCLLNCYVN